MLVLFIMLVLLLVYLSSGNRQQQEPQATEPPRAIKKDGYKRFKTINAIKQEKQQKALYQELLKEFYVYNPHGSLSDLREWERVHNIKDQAKNPYKYRKIEKSHKPQREINSSVLSAKALDHMRNRNK